ncbi:pheromone precursor [Lentinula raphanica]|nr:pheromone precursor [Lentinula raphanica]
MDTFAAFQDLCPASSLLTDAQDESCSTPSDHHNESHVSVPVDSEAVGSGDIIGFCVIS